MNEQDESISKNIKREESEFVRFYAKGTFVEEGVLFLNSINPCGIAPVALVIHAKAKDIAVGDF